MKNYLEKFLYLRIKLLSVLPPAFLYILFHRQVQAVSWDLSHPRQDLWSKGHNCPLRLLSHRWLRSIFLPKTVRPGTSDTWMPVGILCQILRGDYLRSLRKLLLPEHILRCRQASIHRAATLRRVLRREISYWSKVSIFHNRPPRSNQNSLQRRLRVL